MAKRKHTPIQNVGPLEEAVHKAKALLPPGFAIVARDTDPEAVRNRLFRLFEVQGICQLVRRRLEMLDGEDAEINPMRCSLDVVVRMLEEIATELEPACG